jgi:hypothetical protein
MIGRASISIGMTSQPGGLGRETLDRETALDQAKDGTSGWTSVDQFCTDICRSLLDVANFANDLVALTSGLANGSLLIMKPSSAPERLAHRSALRAAVRIARLRLLAP